MRPGFPYQRRIGVAALLLCCVATGVSAQLDQHCTVSVLNRNVQVNADGSWVLPNVPANLGQVRARATCVRDGVTTSGESAFFTLPANGVVNLPDIVLGSTTPIPVALTITPAQVSFSTRGQTSQLAVRAAYPDGTTQDVTAAATGTSYITSNPALATVSADGLVTAVASGTVVIQATLDGAAGLTTVTVMLSSSDSDGDGLPDDAEMALGLNPNNPIDAREDLDRDGLTNLQEFRLGTNVRLADSDGDGLPDGQEVSLGTNPLVADTDGDGIRDGLEIATGSNPLDPTSFNLGQALTALEVTPVNFVITVNAVIGEGSRQLTVTGRLRDGSTLDLTSTARRTNYTSSALTICNFGAPDGRVFGSADGTCTITVTNSGLTASSVGTVRTFAPVGLSSLPIPGYANNVDIRGTLAYIAAGATGLQVVDATNPRLPRIVGAVDTPGNANDVRVLDTLAYVADGDAGLQIIDISDPTRPRLVGAVDTPGEAQDVIIVGTRAYIADGPQGLQIIDVANPTAPRLVGAVATPGMARGVDVAENVAVIADGAQPSAVRIIDVTNPNAPVMVGSVAIPGEAKDLVVRGTVAYVVAFTGGLQLVDFSTPSAPRLVSGLPSTFVPRDIELSGPFALLAEQLFPNAVPIVDVSDPANPRFRATLDFSLLGDYAGTGIALTPQLVYMTGESFIVRTDNGTTGDTRLFIGQYLARDDTAGMPPTVSVVSPTAGDPVLEGQTITLRAEATDDIAVASVTLLAQGMRVATVTAIPFEANFTVPVGLTSLTIDAQAIDFGANISTATVTVPVIPDPGTTVMGRVVDLSGQPVVGATVTCLGISSVTGANGVFTIPGVPTVRETVQCSATFTTLDGKTLRGTSSSVPAVRSGTTTLEPFSVRRSATFGTDFWLAFQGDNEGHCGQIIVLSDAMTGFTVTGPGFSITGTAAPGAPGIVALPGSLEVQTNQIVENKGLRVVSTRDVSVLFFHCAGNSSDIYVALPTETLGTEYIAAGYQESLSDRGFSGTQSPSELLLVATQDATTVSLQTSCRSLSGTPAGSTVQVGLNRGQTYQYRCGNKGDVTGSLISSDKPVGVIAGNSCADVPPGVAACDVLAEMMFPVRTLYDTAFLTVPLPGNGNDVFRFVAAMDGTTVTVDVGEVATDFTLNRGQFQEVTMKTPARIQSNKPISVVQYAVGNNQAGRGDPFSMQLIPTAAFQTNARLFTPAGYSQGTFAIIIAPNEVVAAVKVNGSVVTGFSPLLDGIHQFVVAPVPVGESVIEAPQPIGVYGIGFTPNGSYGYPVGF